MPRHDGSHAAHEVVVLGGGPAGVAAAILLARRAHDVGLVLPARPAQPALGQSVPPSARRLLEELGLAETIDRAGFVPNEGNTVWWAGRDARIETFADGEAGFHAERERLETAIVAAAEAVGVRVHRGATARRALESPEGWTIHCDVLDAPALTLTGRWALDATGRHGFLARHEGREPDRATTTLALVQRWRVPTDGTHTLVESHRDGWAWSIPVEPRARCVTAMVDQRHVSLAGADVAAALAAELAKTEHLAASLAEGDPDGPAWACPASLYTSGRFGRPGLLLVGDAGSTIDPLSSYGVKKALSSGWMAGIVAHTALVDPPMAATAVDFFDEREREVYGESRRASVAFFEEAAAFHGDDFWTARARAARRAAPDERGIRGAEAVGEPFATDRPAPSAGPVGEPFGTGRPTPSEASVRAAFEEIRARERLDAEVGPTLRTVSRPAIRGHRIVTEDHLASAEHPGGLRWVRGVDLAELVRIAPDHGSVPDGWIAYNAAVQPVALPDYLTALSTAFAAALLVHGSA